MKYYPSFRKKIYFSVESITTGTEIRSVVSRVGLEVWLNW